MPRCRRPPRVTGKSRQIVRSARELVTLMLVCRCDSFGDSLIPAYREVWSAMTHLCAKRCGVDRGHRRSWFDPGSSAPHRHDHPLPEDFDGLSGDDSCSSSWFVEVESVMNGKLVDAGVLVVCLGASDRRDGSPGSGELPHRVVRRNCVALVQRARPSRTENRRPARPMAAQAIVVRGEDAA